MDALPVAAGAEESPPPANNKHAAPMEFSMGAFLINLQENIGKNI
jgi:hypothetical protein